MATRRMARSAAGALAAGALVVGAFIAPAGASSGDTARDGGHQATQRVLNALVQAGVPGITVQARDRRGSGGVRRGSATA
ncbi:hypothetical protein GCM10010357_12010 [Streptomyces luteireticuli]|uniref:Uncharacterized protein n=1 Tax=Streptomyces luteireticuli TaxID=173858 RepID=A0ABN0YEF3_9ACTN